MSIIPLGFAEVTVPMRHVNASRTANVVFGVDVNSFADDPTALANSVRDSWASTLGTLFDGGVVGLPLEVRWNADGIDPVVGVSETGWGTSRAQDSQPSNVAALLRKQSARGGRRGRGRMFLPWVLTDGSVDDVGNVNGAMISDLNAQANALLGALAVEATPMVLLHSAGQTPTGPPNPVTSLTADALVGTQRRRLGR